MKERSEEFLELIERFQNSRNLVEQRNDSLTRNTIVNYPLVDGNSFYLFLNIQKMIIE